MEVEAAYYSLPPGWIGRAVKVQWDTLHVRILDPETHQLLREHVGQKRGGYRVRPEDNPKTTPVTTVQLLARAARAGDHIGELAKAIHLRQGEAAIRRILGLFSLAKNTVSPPSRMPPPRHSNSTSMITVSSAAIWNGGLH